MTIRIGIVEDDHQIKKNLVTRFSFFDDIKVTFQAANGQECLDRLNKLHKAELPHILLMDIEMPNMTGIETTARVKSDYPEIDIMMQTVFEDQERIFNSIQAGAAGYLLKDDPIDKYVEAIRDMKNGGAPVSPTVALKLLDYMRKSQEQAEKTKAESAEEFDLTDRELEILQGVVDDLTEAQIAEQLYISPHTVRTHIKNIYKKLHVHSRASAVRTALENKLVD